MNLHGEICDVCEHIDAAQDLEKDRVASRAAAYSPSDDHPRQNCNDQAKNLLTNRSSEDHSVAPLSIALGGLTRFQSRRLLRCVVAGGALPWMWRFLLVIDLRH
jgi:hypothetical protein